jgi:plasmid stabilization system protein ParE
MLFTGPASCRVARTIYDGCDRLKNPAALGEPAAACQDDGSLPPLLYIVVYQIMDYAVEISGIFHAAQDWTIKALAANPPLFYRAINRAITLLSGASTAGIDPQAFAPAVHSFSAADVLLSIASL